MFSETGGQLAPSDAPHVQGLPLTTSIVSGIVDDPRFFTI